MMESETEYLQPVIGTLHLERFKPLSTCKATLLQLFLTLLLEVVAILLLIPSATFISKCDLLYIMFYSQSAFWFISLLLDHYYKWRHHFLRLDGHFEFHEKSTKYATLSFYIISFWNAVLIATIGVLCNMHISFEHLCLESQFFSAVNIFSLIITLESLMLIPLYITYLLCVHNFNKTHPKPDVKKRECWIADDSLAAGEVGYRCDGEAVADLLQEQADLIYYYKCLNDALYNKIMELSVQIRGRE